MKNNYADRKYIIMAIILLIGLVFLGRLYFVQIVEVKYKLSADNNVIRKKTIYPSRGIMYDRNKAILVANDAAYDLMVIPEQLKEMDTTRFCTILNITKESFNKR
ncbi:MAG: penicillin-binding protein 2, partial [Bacteroidales bacterium]|nr:penicillin-binding protein 2 [Bacteroidales bacterium]